MDASFDLGSHTRPTSTASPQAQRAFDDTLARACQHPNNVWSLHGFHECLMRLGKHGEARIVAQQLGIATTYADVPIKASCACRLS